MEWHKPHYNKRGKRVPINPSVRKLFNPVERPETSTLVALIGSLYVSCNSADAFQYVSEAAVNYLTEYDVNVENGPNTLWNMVLVPSSFQCPPLVCSKASSISGGLQDLSLLLEIGTEQKGSDICTALHLSEILGGLYNSPTSTSPACTLHSHNSTQHKLVCLKQHKLND